MVSSLVFNQVIIQQSLQTVRHILNGFNYFSSYVERQSITNDYDWIRYHPNAHYLTVSIYWIIKEQRETEIIPYITDLIHILTAMVKDYKTVNGINAGIYLEFIDMSLFYLKSIKESFSLLLDTTIIEAPIGLSRACRTQILKNGQ